MMAVERGEASPKGSRKPSSQTSENAQKVLAAFIDRRKPYIWMLNAFGFERRVIVDVQGISAVISGGASGLGLSAARRLATRGVFVVLLDLPASRGEDMARELGAAARFVPGDVRDEAAVEEAVAAAAAVAPLRVAVACAGTATAHKTVGRNGPAPIDGFADTLTINVVGTFNLIRLAAAEMAKLDPVGGERGVVVATASIAAYDGQRGQAAYAAAKGGIVAMTLPVARDLAPLKIRMMTVAPGIFDTPILDGLTPAQVATLREQVPHPARLGAADEFAALVEHIVDNPMLNGETIRIDAAVRLGTK
ncbi:SDR family NAD(P)-dependent oxidoreductase [Actinomadura sp. 1N219]|uniref:SDR family NAD(P)-dependent oxidoreductase n=1 Tax=Actinomadura sp. 1N219 TaxID=3375152 RepID=UPI00379B2536